MGIWVTKDGAAAAFVAAWNQLAADTASDFPGATAVLLRDRDDPNRFVSVGPWESAEQIDAWRASDAFQRGVGRIRETLESFTPATLDVVTRID